MTCVPYRNGPAMSQLSNAGLWLNLGKSLWPVCTTHLFVVDIGGGRHEKSLGGYAIHFNTIMFLFDFSLNSDFSRFSSVQFSSVAQSCPTLCDPMNRSTPGLPVHHICSWIVLRNKKERTTNTTTWLNLKWLMLSKRNKTQSLDCESIYVTCLPRAGPQARGWLQILTR